MTLSTLGVGRGRLGAAFEGAGEKNKAIHGG